MRLLNVVSAIVLFSMSSAVMALSCKQSEITPLADVHQQTALLSAQFVKILHIEVLPQRMIAVDDGFNVEKVQILMCGELVPQTPRNVNEPSTPSSTKEATTVPGQCQFDSDCSRPKRCLNNRCLMPNGP